MTPIRLGISTCPNDTFTFHALINRCIDTLGLDFQIELLDIEQLNVGLRTDRFDVAKTSFHAALLMADRIWVLPSGSALGFGVGPLLLAVKPFTSGMNSSQLTLCPGAQTTATLLWQLFYEKKTRLEQALFSNIMPALQNGEADFGVCIHEGRFTYHQSGLFLVEDLGTRWESETHCPLPLGGLVAMRTLSKELIATIQMVIAQSLRYALLNRVETIPTMRKYAQEFDDDTLMQHVDLYVNDWTMELGPVGANALKKLSQMAAEAGIKKAGKLEIFSIS